MENIKRFVQNKRVKSFVLGLLEAVFSVTLFQSLKFLRELNPEEKTAGIVMLTLFLEQLGRYLTKRNRKEVEVID